MFAPLRFLIPVAALGALAGGTATAQDAAGPGPVTYADALHRMQGKHEALQAAGKEITQREEERRATRSLYWPKADANARATQIDDPIDLDLNPIRSVILKLHPLVPSAYVPSFSERLQDERFWLADVTVSWPLYTGGRITAANRAAEARVRDAEALRDLTGEALATELARRYFGLRLAISARDVRALVLDGLDKHLHDAKRLEEEGLISRAERLHAEVARSEASRQLRAAEHDIDIARAGLANMLSEDHVGDPASPLFLLPSVDPLDAFQQHGQARHPAFARFAAQRAMADQALKAERAAWFPTVYLFGQRQLHTADLTVLDPKWAAGVGATFTLFDGFERGHKTAAARLQRSRVDDLERRTRRDIRTLTEKRYEELAKARDQFEALKSAEDLAGENLRVRTRAFEEGLATSLDVVDARLSAARVQLERLAAAYQFDVALAELLEASGQSDRFEALQAAGVPVGVPAATGDGREAKEALR